MNLKLSLAGLLSLSFLCLLPQPCLAQDKTAVKEAGTEAAPLDQGRVLILGDSITAGGHYVSYAEYLLNRQFPEQTFDIISIGLSSETASGLSESDHPFPRPCVHERLDRALAAVKPKVVVACYGMNDGIYHPQSEKRLQAYIDGMNKLETACRKAGAETVVLVGPPPFDPVSANKLASTDATDWSYKAPHPNYHEVLEDYARWVRQSERRWIVDFNRPLTRAAAEARKTKPDFSFSGDGIHPNSDGHFLMAKALLGDLKIPFPEELTREEVEADPLFKKVDARRRARSSAWLKHVGYTRGKTVGPEPLGDIGKRAAAMQEEIDTMRRKAAVVP